MKSDTTSSRLWEILRESLDEATTGWLRQKTEKIISEKSGRELFLTYSLIASRVKDTQLQLTSDGEPDQYLNDHQATGRQVARLYLLTAVLEADKMTFSPKVSQLIQVADKGELETFLRYLSLLPDAGDFRSAAVEALRTNISTVFDAIALDNPYPASYFNDQQWNQMFLKAAFMQRDLSRIQAVDKRANKDLARIISDYAHERWAASREVDPLFWRPVTNFITGGVLEDMKKLLASESAAENRAGALCCYYSAQEEARELLRGHEELRAGIENGKITWDNVN